MTYIKTGWKKDNFDFSDEGHVVLSATRFSDYIDTSKDKRKAREVKNNGLIEGYCHLDQIHPLSKTVIHEVSMQI